MDSKMGETSYSFASMLIQRSYLAVPGRPSRVRWVYHVYDMT